MIKNLCLLTLVVLVLSCQERRNVQNQTASRTEQTAPEGSVLIARDIVTETIIRPDPEGDPWDIEKVEGFEGSAMINGIFERIYNGTLTVSDYHSGEILSPDDVRKLEREFNNDRNRIGKLSFTEDWYYNAASNSIEKRVKTIAFGYELYNNLGKVYAYRAAFRADLGTSDKN